MIEGVVADSLHETVAAWPAQGRALVASPRVRAAVCLPIPRTCSHDNPGSFPMRHRWTVALLVLAGCSRRSPACQCAAAAAPASAESVRVAVPLLDHHQHLLSEGARKATADFIRGIGDTSLAREAAREPLVDADRLVHLLDEAGIAKALVFSNAYYFARSAAERPGEYEQVRAENDWTLAQVRRHPDRLYAACSVNPRRGYAAAEIERCAASGGFRALKLHFDGSGVDLGNPAHVASVRQVFAIANRLRLPIIAHLQSEAGYGGPQARTFLGEVMPEAPGVPVTVNHLWGGGRYGPEAAEALAVFAGLAATEGSITSAATRPACRFRGYRSFGLPGCVARASSVWPSSG